MIKSESEKSKKNQKNTASNKKCYYDWLERAEEKTFKAWEKNK